MANQSGGFEGEGAEEAAVAFGGEPQEVPDGFTSDAETPSAQELDAREERFTGPRKPMGPEEEEGVPPTVPDEG